MRNVCSPVRSPRQRYRRALRHLETLEPRTLLSVVVTSHVIPNSMISGGAYDSSGKLWVYDGNADNGNTGALERLANGAVDTEPNSVIPLDFNTYYPTAFAIGANDHLYMADVNGGIDDVNLATCTVTQALFTTPGAADAPTALTVTGDGAVWFVGWGTSTSETDAGGAIITHHTSVIGRLDPANQQLNPNQQPMEYTTGAALQDSVASFIAASGADSVWIGLGAADDQNGIPGQRTLGTNRIASASFTPAVGIQINQAWAVTTGDAIADNTNTLASVVDGGDGSVWFALANIQYSTHPDTRAPDQIVHGVVSGGALVQTTHVVAGADAQNPLGLTGLAFDADRNLWFCEVSGPNVGYLSAAGSYSFVANSTINIPPTIFPFKTIANADGTQLSMFTFSDGAGELPIIQIDVGTPQVTFSGSANNLTIQEDTPIASNTLLATFTAPTPAGAYSAVINWGDNTSTTVTPTALGNNTYAIIVSGKTFATQSNSAGYAGTITVKDVNGSQSTVAGTLTFVSHVGDIPLNVTSITGVPLILRIVTAAGTFTDDGDLPLSTWTATINWGDGTSSTGLIVRDPTHAGRYLVLALHQYRTRGTYTMRLTVSTNELLGAVTRNTLTTLVAVR